ncbi:MAG: sulfatase, partial [Planctomycetaceae bacterium]
MTRVPRRTSGSVVGTAGRCRGLESDTPSRRTLLSRCGYGIGSLALSDLVSSDGGFGFGEESSASGPQTMPRAKRMIFL